MPILHNGTINNVVAGVNDVEQCYENISYYEEIINLEVMNKRIRWLTALTTQH